MSAEAIATFSAISGLPPDQCTMWLEMSGGDVETAIGLFMGGMDAPMEVPSSMDVPEWYGIVWPEAKEVPDKWLGQDLTFDSRSGCKLGLIQAKNGPCGVLAAIQAVIVAQNFKEDGFGPDFAVSDEALAQALGTIIARCRPSSNESIRLCEWKDDSKAGGQVEEIKFETEELLKEHLVANIAKYKGAGGPVLVMYSCVITRGVENIKKDMAAVGGSPPLVVGSAWLCSFDLLSLFMRGTANGNFAAYNMLNPDNKIDWEDPDVGFLSSSFETQASMPVADSLKSPNLPIWICHGGDHFTVMFALEAVDEKSTDDDDEKKQEEEEEAEEKSKSKDITLYHWNGLPPAGPRMATIQIKARVSKSGKTVTAKKADKKRNQVYYKPIPGEIDSIVQPDQDQKKANPEKWFEWRYEVMLAFDDPTVQGEERPDDMPKPRLYEQGEPTPGPWRCTRCYATRFKTMAFRQTPDGEPNCVHCSKPREECGWSIWLDYDELPRGWQASCVRQYAPKMVSLLQTKWPGSKWEFEADLPAPSV